MITDLALLKVYGAMARHAAQSQSVSAENIARAQEPGFKATEMESFQAYLKRVSDGTDVDVSREFKRIQSSSPASANGNTVSLEQELFKSAEAMSQHDMALSIYTKSIDLLRTAIGKNR